MSVHYKRLVIDTDIVSSAGGEHARDIRSITCRDFLKLVLQTDHQVVITDAIMDEWKRHRSSFTHTWLTKMYGRKKVLRIDQTHDDNLRSQIERAASTEIKQQAMLKDAHLIEAALKVDKIVISIDGTVRGYFQEIVLRVNILKTIAWINPCKDDKCSLWLINGAEPQDEHLLGYFAEA